MYKALNINNKFWLLIGYFSLALGISPLTTQILPQIGNIIEPFILFGIFLITKNNSYKIPFPIVFKSKKSISVLTQL